MAAKRLELQMPEMDGLQATKEIRASQLGIAAPYCCHDCQCNGFPPGAISGGRQTLKELAANIAAPKLVHSAIAVEQALNTACAPRQLAGLLAQLKHNLATQVNAIGEGLPAPKRNPMSTRLPRQIRDNWRR